jgi:L,D-transpeptidase YcbB
LGQVKFLFPNDHSIYMHDTDKRELFTEDVRSFSHGCVRVENPRRFAEILFGWTPEQVDAQIESGETTRVKIPGKPKVHLAYFAAWPDDTGTVRYYKDLYERDKSLTSALDQTRNRLTKTARQFAGNEPLVEDVIQ